MSSDAAWGGLSWVRRTWHPVGWVVFFTVVALGLAQGGYFPAAWGWGSVGLLCVAATALLVRPQRRLGRLELTFVASLAALVAWTALSAAWSDDVPDTVLEV